MPRGLKPTTPLARLVLASDKPAYVVAGEVAINSTRFLDYCNGRVQLSTAHATELARYFDTTLDEVLGEAGAADSGRDGETEAPTFTEAVFACEVGDMRVKPGGDAVLKLACGPEAWALSGAPKMALDVWKRHEARFTWEDGVVREDGLWEAARSDLLELLDEHENADDWSLTDRRDFGSSSEIVDSRFDAEGPKPTKGDVHYGEPADGEAARCDECRFFAEPDRCHRIEGQVEADGLCDAFEPLKYLRYVKEARATGFAHACTATVDDVVGRRCGDGAEVVLRLRISSDEKDSAFRYLVNASDADYFEMKVTAAAPETVEQKAS